LAWEAAVNTGNVLFAQLINLFPWTSYSRSVAKYGGDLLVRSLSCAEQFRAMVYAQLTLRESLPTSKPVSAYNRASSITWDFAPLYVALRGPR
jgi:hypothetical protein